MKKHPVYHILVTPGISATVCQGSREHQGGCGEHQAEGQDQHQQGEDQEWIWQKRPNLALVGSEAVLIDLQFDEIVSKWIPQVTADAVVVEKVFKAWHLQIPHTFMLVKQNVILVPDTTF